MKTEKKDKQSKKMNGCTPEHLLLINLRIISNRSVKDIRFMVQYVLDAGKIREDYYELIKSAEEVTTSDENGFYYTDNTEFEIALGKLKDAIDDAKKAKTDVIKNGCASECFIDSLNPIDTALCNLKKKLRGDPNEEVCLKQLEDDINLCAGESIPDWVLDNSGGSAGLSKKDLFYRLVGNDLSTSLDSGANKTDKKACINALLCKVYPMLIQKNPELYEYFFQNKARRLLLLTSILSPQARCFGLETDGIKHFSVEESSLHFENLMTKMNSVLSELQGNGKKLGETLQELFEWVGVYSKTDLFHSISSNSTSSVPCTRQSYSQSSGNSEHGGPVSSSEDKYKINVVYFNGHIMSYLEEMESGTDNGREKATAIEKKEQLAKLTSDILEKYYEVFDIAFSEESDIEATTNSIICEERFFVLQLIIKKAYKDTFQKEEIA